MFYFLYDKQFIPQKLDRNHYNNLIWYLQLELSHSWWFWLRVDLDPVKQVGLETM